MKDDVSQGDPVLLRAVQWLVLMRSGAADDEAEQEFAAWRAEDPSHQVACDRIAGALAATDTLRSSGVGAAVATHTLARASRRAVMRASLGVAGLGLGATLAGWNVAEQQGLMADQHTGVAQRRQDTLPDGGTLWLDARTAVDVAIDDTHRQLTLLRGRLLVGAPARPSGPLHVRTPAGTLRTNEARFVVQARADGRLRLTTVNGQVSVARPGQADLQVAEGHHAAFAPAAPVQLAAARGTESMWTQGLIAMDNEPLGELVEALQDYHPGFLRIDPQAAQLRVSGVFSLDKVDVTLQALAETQPVRVRRRTGYWVTVEAV